MASKRVKDGPHWVKAWISDLSALTDQFRDIETGAVDFEALGREEYHFRMALSRRDFSLSERARKVWEDAVGPYQQRVSAAKKNQDTTADGDTREDSLNIQDGRNAGKLESGTSANLYGDTATRESADESTTVSKNLGSGKPKTQAQNDQRRAGGHLLPSSSLNGPPARSGAVDVLNLAYAGEFGNVRLTQEQYAQLGIKFGNQQKLNRAIDSLSCQLENGEKNPANHYAELVKWASYRDDMEEKEELRASSAPHYETVSEHNARIVRESDKWIDEYYAQKRKAANGK